MIKSSERSDQFFSRGMSQIVEKALSRNVEESIKEFLHLDSDVNDFKINQFFLVQRYVSDKVFTKIQSAVFRKKLLTGRQKDR